MKILYIITQAVSGGAQKYVYDLATNLDKAKYDILVAAGGHIDEELFFKLNKKGIKIYPLKHLKRKINFFHDPMAFFEIRKLIKAYKPDIVHLNSSKAGAIGSIAAFFVSLKIKVLYTVHGFVFNEPLSKFKKIFYLCAENFTGYFKDKLIAVSEFDREIGIQKKIAPPEKIITIHPGIDLTKINLLPKKIAREKLNLPQESFVIGVVANYYATKNLDRLIDAAEILTKKFNNLKFILIGENGTERIKLEEKIRANNLANNFLLGAVAGASEYLTAFDIFVLPSAKEGFPYTILEAMHAEIPVVATKVGGIPEMITDGKNGFLVLSNKKTPELLAEKIEYLIKNTEVAKIFTEKAYRRLTDEFTLAKMIKKTEEAYNE